MVTDREQVVHMLFEPGGKPSNSSMLESLFEYGCRTQPNGSSRFCRYHVDGMRIPESGAPTKEAIDNLETSNGFIFSICDIELSFYTTPFGDYNPGLPCVTFLSPKHQYVPYPTQKAGQKRVYCLVDLVTYLADERDALYGFGCQACGEFDSHWQDPDSILAGRPERLFWYNYFSESMVDTLGRERVLSAPAPRVEERDNGAVLFLTDRNPEDPDDDPAVSRSELTEYLVLSRQ